MSFRVAVIEFINESNTFTVIPTDMHDFLASHYFKGDEILARFKGTGSEVGGCIDVAEEREWSPVFITAAHAEPGGIVTEAARKEITGECLRRLQENGPFDGVFVALHGAMVTETDQDGDSQFLREIRSVVGHRVPLAVTFDLHANIFDETADLAQIAVSFRTYPHVDMYEAGFEAAELLHRAMTGEITPRLTIKRPPLLLGCDDGRTTEDGPMCRLLESAKKEMNAWGILNVAINAGFTDADVWAAGPSVLVTYDAVKVVPETAAGIGARICEQIWDYRDEWDLPISLSDSIDRVQDLLSQNPEPLGPIVMADYSDNPGAGAYSDCTAMISAMLEAGISNAAVGALWDPIAATESAEAGVGARVTLSIGGKCDPSVGGGPLVLAGEVRAISDGAFIFEGPMFTGLPGSTGLSVCFRVKGIDIMIVTDRMQMLDRNIFRLVDIEPARKSVLAVKSMQHFKGAFAPIASAIITVDAGGLCTPDVTKRIYNHIRRPVYPLETVNA